MERLVRWLTVRCYRACCLIVLVLSSLVIDQRNCPKEMKRSTQLVLALQSLKLFDSFVLNDAINQLALTLIMVQFLCPSSLSLVPGQVIMPL